MNEISLLILKIILMLGLNSDVNHKTKEFNETNATQVYKVINEYYVK